MRFATYQSRLSALLKQRNGYLTLSVFLVFLCILLSFTITLLLRYVYYHERIYLIPPRIEQPIWLSQQAPSAQYLSEMSSYLAQLRLNTTPSNATYQHTLLLGYTEPHYYGQLKQQLAEEAQTLETAQLSTGFYPLNITVDESALSATIEGDFYQYTHGEALAPQRHQYHMQYRYQSGRLWLLQFQLEKKDV